MAYAFYDLETTGLDPAYDQPLQFAAILTDNDFNTIEKIDLRCRVAAHILPSPYALAVTGITPDQFLDPSLPSWFEFMQEIRKIINSWAPSTWVGYNTLRFDEEFLRQSFYQTLQPNLYETQFNGNDRLDIMSAVYACWINNHGILNWEGKDSSKSIFKLDQLAPANGFANHNAHDALGDVEATIHIAALIKEQDPNLWTDISANRNKFEVKDKLETFKPLNLIERFGAAPPKAYLGCFCGYDANNPNSAGFLDMTLVDVEQFLDADDATLANAVSKSPKVIRAISTNKVPSLFYAEDCRQESLLSAQFVESRPDFQERVGKALANRYADQEDEELPVEKQIYKGFYSYQDKALLEDFQTASWQKRRELIASFTDPRLKQLGRRLIVLEDPKGASQKELDLAHEYLVNKWRTPMSDKPKWTTFESAEIDLKKIQDAGEVSLGTIETIRNYFNDLKNGFSH